MYNTKFIQDFMNYYDYFCFVHPYFDGNGRMARLLHLWFLIRKGYKSALFIPFSSKIEKTRKKYYDRHLRIEDKLLLRLTALAKVMGYSEYTLHFVFLLSLTEELKNQYTLYGIDERVYYETMGDLKYKLLECMECEKVPGTFVAESRLLLLPSRRCGNLPAAVIDSNFGFPLLPEVHGNPRVGIAAADVHFAQLGNGDDLEEGRGPFGAAFFHRHGEDLLHRIQVAAPLRDLRPQVQETLATVDGGDQAAPFRIFRILPPGTQEVVAEGEVAQGVIQLVDVVGVHAPLEKRAALGVGDADEVVAFGGNGLEHVDGVLRGARLQKHIPEEPCVVEALVVAGGGGGGAVVEFDEAEGVGKTAVPYPTADCYGLVGKIRGGFKDRCDFGEVFFD